MSKTEINKLIDRKVAKIKEAKETANNTVVTVYDVVFDFFQEVEKLNFKLPLDQCNSNILQNTVQYLEDRVKSFDRKAKVIPIWREDDIYRSERVRILWSSDYAKFHGIEQDTYIDITDMILR